MFERAEEFLCTKPVMMTRILEFRSAFSLKSCWVSWQGCGRSVVPVITSRWNGAYGFSKADFLYYLIGASAAPWEEYRAFGEAQKWSHVTGERASQRQTLQGPSVLTAPRKAADLCSLQFLLEETDAYSILPKHTQVRRNHGLEPKPLSVTARSVLTTDQHSLHRAGTPDLPGGEVEVAS